MKLGTLLEAVGKSGNGVHITVKTGGAGTSKKDDKKKPAARKSGAGKQSAGKQLRELLAHHDHATIYHRDRAHAHGEWVDYHKKTRGLGHLGLIHDEIRDGHEKLRRSYTRLSNATYSAIKRPAINEKKADKKKPAKKVKAKKKKKTLKEHIELNEMKFSFGYEKGDTKGEARLKHARGLSKLHNLARKTFGDAGVIDKKTTLKTSVHRFGRFEKNNPKRDEYPNKRSGFAYVRKGDEARSRVYVDSKRAYNENEVNELSRQTLGRYVKAASRASRDNQGAAATEMGNSHAASRTGNKDLTHAHIQRAAKWYNKSDKRIRGIDRAVKRLGEDELDEASTEQHAALKAKILDHMDSQYQGVAPDLPRQGNHHYVSAQGHLADNAHDEFHKHEHYSRSRHNLSAYAAQTLKRYGADDRRESRITDYKRDQVHKKRWDVANQPPRPPKWRLAGKRTPRTGQSYNTKAGYTFVGKPRRGVGSQ